MPIRIWNTPGGPVTYGYELGDYNIRPEEGDVEGEIERLKKIGYDPQRMAEEAAGRAGVPRTPSGRYVFPPNENTRLDMTRPRNEMAMMGLREFKGGPLYTDIEGVELDPRIRAANRMATPYSFRETMEIEPALVDKLGTRWRGAESWKESLKPKSYEYESESLPTKSELEMSSDIWKAAQRPLLTRSAEAETDKSFAEAESKRAEAGLYRSQAKAAEARIGQESDEDITSKTNQLKMYATLLNTAVKEGKISIDEAKKRFDDMRKILFGGEVASLPTETRETAQPDLGGLNWDAVVENLGPR